MNRAVLDKYHKACNTPSDINELLPFLRAVAEKCDMITEFGVRQPTSTWAFLAGEPILLTSYDIIRSPLVDEVEELATQGMFKFIEGSTLEVDIEPTDFLFIDTYHTALQCAEELRLHADKVRKYIGFHDTHTFWETAEQPYEGIDPKWNDGKGLGYAIEPFIKAGGWKIDFTTPNNNGLTILKRV
jgi:hypothetical protein